MQQLSWNLFVLTDKVATREDLDEAIDDTLSQNNSFFTEQIKDLTAYQLNFLKAIASGLHSGFTSAKVLSEWHLGAKSNALIGIIGPRPVAQDQFEMFRYGKWNEAARNARGFSASSWMTPARATPRLT